MRVGVFQYSPVESAEENIEILLARLEAQSDALVVLPELFLMDTSDPTPIQSAALLEVLEPLLRLTEENDLFLVGTVAIEQEQSRFNRMLHIGEGRILGTYDKRKLFRNERAVFRPGMEDIGRFAYRDHPFCGQVCLDLIDPIPVARAVRAAGVGLLVVSSAVSVDFLLSLARARSLENQIITVWTNRCGSDKHGNQYLGRSTVFRPDGTLIEVDQGENLSVVDFSDRELAAFRRSRREFCCSRMPGSSPHMVP